MVSAYPTYQDISGQVHMRICQDNMDMQISVHNGTIRTGHSGAIVDILPCPIWVCLCRYVCLLGMHSYGDIPHAIGVGTE